MDFTQIGMPFTLFSLGIAVPAPAGKDAGKRGALGGLQGKSTLANTFAG